MPESFTSRIRVRYAETDQMGVVYYGNYFTWFEIGRAEMLRSLGLSYRAMEEAGAVLPVAKASCRYRMPARYDDEILIRTRCLRLRSAVVTFGYELLCVARSDDGAPEYVLLAEGETTHVVVDHALNAISMPEQYAEALRTTMVPQAETVTAAGQL